jgi:hypothetical protein
MEGEGVKERKEERVGGERKTCRRNCNCQLPNACFCTCAPERGEFPVILFLLAFAFNGSWPHLISSFKSLNRKSSTVLVHSSILRLPSALPTLHLLSAVAAARTVDEKGGPKRSSPRTDSNSDPSLQKE